jgi:hypothetical protein
MPLIINRPGFPPENVLTHLVVDVDSMLFELAKTAQSSLQAYTPNRWKGYLYKAVSVLDEIPDGYGVGGPIGQGGLLPEPSSARKNTISDFLEEHDEFRTSGNVPKNMAWWYLPPEGKRKLKQERMGGKYGGMPERAPYWLIAEYGSTAGISSVDTNVPALEYIRKSRADVAAKEAQLRAALNITP